MTRRLLLILCLALVACDDALVEPTIASFTIEEPAHRLFPGDTIRLTAIAANDKGEYLQESIAWETSDTTIARVTQSGDVIAVRPGRASITARIAGVRAEQAVLIDSGFVFIETGPAATCAFRHNGELYCWGEVRAIGSMRELGNFVEIPKRVPTSLRFKQISIGSNAMCAVTYELEPYCWGTGRKGETGSGAVLFHESSVPLRVAGGHRFKEVSAGWEHSCGLTPDGIAYCWGRNFEGQLGTGELEFAVEWVPVRVATDLRFKQLQAAGSNTCGLTIDGDMYCWGRREYLGDPKYTEHQATPQRINVPKLRMFDSANDDPCGITLDDQLYCWTNKVEHIAVVGRVADVTVGGYETCAVQIGGNVVCWKTNETPQPVDPAAGMRFRQIAAGSNHLCGLTDTGAAYCWGSGTYGQLGNGTRGMAPSPSRVLITHAFDN